MSEIPQNSKFCEQDKTNLYAQYMFTTKLKITQVEKSKISLVTLQTYSNGTYLRNRLANISLFLQNLFLAEPIFEIGSLNLFNMKPTFRYRKILKFEAWKKLVLARYEILGWLFNIFTADDEYTPHHRENLPLLLQMQLCKKFKTFCLLLFRFWNLY